jgi:hypothetical protein
LQVRALLGTYLNFKGMIIDYNKIEKIPYLNSKIDHEFNLRLIKAFEKLYFKILDEKIEFILTGGLGSCLYYKKIYRTLLDIDLLIEDKDLGKWYRVFKEGAYNFCYEDHYKQNPVQRIEDFKNRKINSLIFLDNEFKVKIEIINSEFSKIMDFHEIEINTFTLKVIQPFYSYKNKITFRRKKDLEDWEFFNKFLINT